PTVPPLERDPYSRRRRDFLSKFVVVRKSLGEKGTSTSLLLRFHTASWSFWNWAEVSKSNNSLISLGSSSGDIHALVIASSKNVSRLTPSCRSFTSSLRGGCASTSLYPSRRSNARRRTGIFSASICSATSLIRSMISTPCAWPESASEDGSLGTDRNCCSSISSSACRSPRKQRRTTVSGRCAFLIISRTL